MLRIFKYTIQDMYRNVGLAFMTVVVLVLMVLSVNVLMTFQVLTEKAVTSINEQIDLSVHLSHDVTEAQIENIQEYIGVLSMVETMTYLDADEVLEIFKEKNKHKPNILASLDELDTNPFGPSIVIKAHEPDQYQEISRALDVPEYQAFIQDTDFNNTKDGISRITDITEQVKIATMVLIALFAFIAVVIIFNVIRVTIYTQRTEISVKRLVGASNWFIRGPYILAAFVYSLLSVGFAQVIVYLSLDSLDQRLTVVFNESYILTDYFNEHILYLASSQFGAVLVLTVFTTYVAMRRYLRV